MTLCKKCGCRTANTFDTERRYADNLSTHHRLIQRCENCGTIKKYGRWHTERSPIALDPDQA